MFREIFNFQYCVILSCCLYGEIKTYVCIGKHSLLVHVARLF